MAARGGKVSGRVLSRGGVGRRGSSAGMTTKGTGRTGRGDAADTPAQSAARLALQRPRRGPDGGEPAPLPAAVWAAAAERRAAPPPALCGRRGLGAAPLLAGSAGPPATRPRLGKAAVRWQVRRQAARPAAPGVVE